MLKMFICGFYLLRKPQMMRIPLAQHGAVSALTGDQVGGTVRERMVHLAP
ncbi:MAG: hypothetical protein K0U93_10550 [Gammaproteobacteria bacterium]|nr:hypothetical protein [Gammaproteobacteria bacterium]